MDCFHSRISLSRRVESLSWLIQTMNGETSLYVFNSAHEYAWVRDNALYMKRASLVYYLATDVDGFGGFLCLVLRMGGGR
jgi:hypothetical protein